MHELIKFSKQSVKYTCMQRAEAPLLPALGQVKFAEGNEMKDHAAIAMRTSDSQSSTKVT